MQPWQVSVQARLVDDRGGAEPDLAEEVGRGVVAVMTVASLVWWERKHTGA